MSDQEDHRFQSSIRIIDRHVFVRECISACQRVCPCVHACDRAPCIRACTCCMLCAKRCGCKCMCAHSDDAVEGVPWVREVAAKTVAQDLEQALKKEEDQDHLIVIFLQ